MLSIGIKVWVILNCQLSAVSVGFPRTPRERECDEHRIHLVFFLIWSRLLQNIHGVHWRMEGWSRLESRRLLAVPIQLRMSDLPGISQSEREQLRP